MPQCTVSYSLLLLVDGCGFLVSLFFSGPFSFIRAPGRVVSVVTGLVFLAFGFCSLSLGVPVVGLGGACFRRLHICCFVCGRTALLQVLTSILGV